ncbi:MAG: helix-turn-helix domain-containing protein, partial [Candidatus Woesearchaeota archaeon]
MKGRIIADLSLFLLKEGYMLKGLNSAFDILARRNDKTLLIKVIQDANSLNASQIMQMKNIASYISGSPLIVAETASYALEGNVVYSRYGVVTITLDTFKECVRKSSPFVRASKAGLTASVDGTKLKGAREKGGYSMNSLAKRIGVSNRMIAKYENED